MTLDHRQVIAIDGPGAAGKSTVAKRLSEETGALLFDTGALYRAVTLLAVRHGVAGSDEPRLAGLARMHVIAIAPPSKQDGRQVDVLLDGEDVTWELRTPEIDARVSEVSAHREVREALLDLQRTIANGARVVMVGRDIGTVVVPQAGVKIYLDASAEERARRRFAELGERGVEASYAQVLADLRARDEIDSNREVAPLSAADDARIIDSDGKTVEQIVGEIVAIAHAGWDSAPMPESQSSSVDHMEGKLQGWKFTLMRVLFLGFFRIAVRMKIVGIEHVPKTGGVLVVSNHLHNADPLLISVACPRPLHYMAKKELMGIPLLGRIIQFGGAFSVNRGKADRQAIRTATEKLQQGIAVGMFPEGTRSVSRQIERVMPGAGLIALRGNAPILPAAIVGSERLPMNGAKQLRAGESPARSWWDVTVTFGEPFTLEPGENGKRMSSEDAIATAMTRVAALLPESYRGIYRDESQD